MDINPSRRSIISTMALGPMVIAAPVVSANAPSTWASAYAAYLRAKAVEEAYDRDVWDPDSAERDRKLAKIPHHAIPFTSHRGEPSTMSTAAPRDVQGAYGMLRACPESVSEYMMACRALITAYEARQAEIHRVSNEPRHAAIDLRGEEIAKDVYDTLKAAIKAPAGNLYELAEKLALIEETDEHEVPNSRLAAIEDAKRLAMEGRA